MKNSGMTRREMLIKSATAAAAASALPLNAGILTPAEFAAQEQRPNQNTGDQADRQRRMQWWHEARFGMFIHCSKGLCLATATAPIAYGRGVGGGIDSRDPRI